jgi:hypothetical protein
MISNVTYVLHGQEVQKNTSQKIQAPKPLIGIEKQQRAPQRLSFQSGQLTLKLKYTGRSKNIGSGFASLRVSVVALFV